MKKTEKLVWALVVVALVATDCMLIHGFGLVNQSIKGLRQDVNSLHGRLDRVEHGGLDR